MLKIHEAINPFVKRLILYGSNWAILGHTTCVTKSAHILWLSIDKFQCYNQQFFNVYHQDTPCRSWLLKLECAWLWYADSTPNISNNDYWRFLVSVLKGIHFLSMCSTCFPLRFYLHTTCTNFLRVYWSSTDFTSLKQVLGKFYI